LRPDIPVLLRTGFAGANAVERCRKSGIEVLRKPLRSRDLAESLRRVLGG